MRCLKNIAAMFSQQESLRSGRFALRGEIKKPSFEHRCKKKNRQNDALNKAVIPAILVLLCIGVRCSAWLLVVRFFQGKRILPGCNP